MAAMTLTYRYPPAVAISQAPTPAQMLGHDRMVVDAVTDGTQTIVQIPHDMGCATTTGNDGSPEVSPVILAMAGATVVDLKVAFVDKNTISVVPAKAATAATWRITIKRPFSVGQ
jgi:hypothetical protein